MRDIRGWRSRNCAAAFRNQAISHVESPDYRGQCSAGVIENDAQIRMTLQHAAIDQQRRGETGVVKIPDQVAQKESGKCSGRRSFKWVDANHHPERLRRFPKNLEVGFIELSVN